MDNLLISGGHVVDAANGLDSIAEILIEDGRISACGSDIVKNSSTKVMNAAGKLVLPGLVDSHVHVSGVVEGFYMLKRAGVTSALDMNGFAEEIGPCLKAAGTGLNLRFLYPLLPDRTVSGPDPDQAELREVIEKALASGAYGIKIIGGHYPLTPRAQRITLEICKDLSCYCAVHAGSTETGSNIEGLEELGEIAGDLPVHIAHVNSYCRGQITGNPVEEAGRALNLVKSVPNSVSESYLDIINGTSGKLQDGIPLSNVTKNCLRAGNYPLTAAGLEEAIKAGWARVHGKSGNEIILLPPDEGYSYFKSEDSHVMMSFAVNSPGAAVAIATAKSGREFIVNALSTDGGKIPRNTTLSKALPLVKFGALTLLEFVEKACWRPAQMLQYDSKGHFSTGADADVIIVDPATAKVECVIAAGKAEKF